MAFVLRYFSPLLPVLYGAPQGRFELSNCVVNTPVEPIGTPGTLCGLAYPLNRGYSATPGGALSPPHGEVFDEIYFADFAHNDLKGLEQCHPGDGGQTYAAFTDSQGRRSETITSNGACRWNYFDPEPPFAKELIGLGEVLYGWWRAHVEGAAGDPVDLGFVPFGWRLMSCLFGSLTVPLMYLFALRLWPNRRFALAAGVLTCFDGMFFIQSRIGMIDIFPIFFIVLAYVGFHYHLQAPTPRRASGWLAFTGIVVGLAIAAKWIALAAWATMFLVLAVRYARRQVDLGFETGAGGTWFWGRREELGEWVPGGLALGRYLTLVIVWLVLVPVALYHLAWWPFFMRGQFHSLGDVWSYQLAGYYYHAYLTATHPYGSDWYTWPLLIRPVAYYYEASGLGTDAYTGQPLVAGMVDLGNPAIWWASLPALGYCLYRAVRHRSYPAALILVGFITQYLPWSRITRVIFLYHMFGGLIFMVLALALALGSVGSLAPARITVSGRAVTLRGEWVMYGYLAVVLLVFLYLYPIWTAVPVGQDAYLGGFGKGRMWLPSWI